MVGFFSGVAMEKEEFEALTTDELFRKAVAEQFAAVNTRLSQQDVVLASNTALTQQIANDTSAIRNAWSEGIGAIKFFCRLAAAWKFLLRNVLGPIGVPVALLYGCAYYSVHSSFPPWLKALVNMFV
jgi:hypothetical protein